MRSSFLEGMAAGYGIAIPVGAVAILIVNTALGCGFRAGFAAGAGAATADLLYAVLASLAGAALSGFLAPHSALTRLIGGAALIALALGGVWKSTRAPAALERSVDACRPLQTYMRFVGLTLLNPLTIVYFSAFILGRGTATNGSAASDALFILGVGLASLSWQTLLAGVGGLARRRVTPRFRALGVLFGNLLVCGLGLRLLILALLPALS